MSTELIWSNQLLTGYILVEQSVSELWSSYRQLDVGAKEAGGILLGFRRGTHLHVVDATAPMRRDIRQRTYFERLDPGHQKHATSRWQRTGQRMDYLGEWHTHPELLPTPSYVDKSEWQKITARTRAPMLFAIAGLQGDWMGCCVAKMIRECVPHSS